MPRSRVLHLNLIFGENTKNYITLNFHRNNYKFSGLNNIFFWLLKKKIFYHSIWSTKIKNVYKFENITF